MARPWKNALVYILMTLIALIVLAPLLLTVLGSFKTNAQILEWPPRLLPHPWTYENYARVWGATPLFPRWVLNSILLTAVTIGINVLTCSMAGYSFARLRYPGRDAIFMALLAALMIPGQLILVPKYVLINRLGWIDSYKALIIPEAANVFGMFLMTQFMKSIPRELEEAALIDGCSKWGIYWRVILPLSKPALAALVIFRFKDIWNAFLDPLIYLNTPELFTLTVGLNYFRQEYYTLWNLVLTGAMFNIIPVTIIFLIFQRYFIRGITLTGLKG